MKRALTLALGLCAAAAHGQLDSQLTGHLKGNLTGASYPDDSAWRRLFGAQRQDQSANLRLNAKASHGSFEVSAHYQLIALAGDSYRASRTQAIPGQPLQDDRHRYWDLTDSLSESGEAASLHRLDRAWLGYHSQQWVLRAGRQAVSWGNGLLFNPLDLFNPFDPTAVDKEYKSGDDLAYGQYLFDSGADLQAVYVARRDDQGRATASVSSSALKYHGFLGQDEIDLLLARHYDQPLLGAGLRHNLGDWLWQADLSYQDSADGWVAGAVTNVSRSRVMAGKNVTLSAEYYFNGFGLAERDYPQLAQATELQARLARGELYTIGRHYLALAAGVELTPLWWFNPSLFANLGDGSALLQLTLTWNPSQNSQLLAALNLPVGDTGTEYGGLTWQDGRPLSVTAGLFVQAAWYF